MLVCPHAVTQSGLVSERLHHTSWLQENLGIDSAQCVWDDAWLTEHDEQWFSWAVLAWILTACEISTSDQVQEGACDTVIFVVAAHNFFGLQDRKLNIVISRGRRWWRTSEAGTPRHRAASPSTTSRCGGSSSADSTSWSSGLRRMCPKNLKDNAVASRQSTPRT